MTNEIILIPGPYHRRRAYQLSEKALKAKHIVIQDLYKGDYCDLSHYESYEHAVNAAWEDVMGYYYMKVQRDVELYSLEKLVKVFKEYGQTWPIDFGYIEEAEE